MTTDGVRGIDKRVAAAASTFLVKALAEARRQAIIPTSPRSSRWDRYDGPWPAYWACWEIAHSEIAVPFILALREAYPERFGVVTPFPFKNPEMYVLAYLRAVIAESIVRGEAPSAKSPAVLSMLHELHRVIAATGQRFASLWLIDDVDFESVDGQKVGAITLLHPSYPSELLVSQLVPGGLWASEHSFPSWSKRAGLLYANGSGTGNHWDVTTPMNNSMGRFMQTLRLATATTSPELMVWIGEPSMIHVEDPEAHPQTSGFADSWFRRVATLTPEHLPGLRRLAETIDRLETTTPTAKKTGVPSIVVSIRRHSRSQRALLWQDSVLELATALEACLGPTRNDPQEVALTLKTRATHLLAGDESDEAERIWTDVADLYNMRSDIIHGSPEIRKSPQKLWKERGYAHVLERDSMHVLVDRWRDIVRRAITARLLLADQTLGSPLWPLIGSNTPVDLLLARRDARDKWRARIVEGAAAYGLPLLAAPAPPLIDYLHPPQGD